MQKPTYRTSTERHAQGRIAAFQKKYRIEEAAILCRLRGHDRVEGCSIFRWRCVVFLVARSKGWMTAEAQLLCHLGYEPTARDQHDMRLLSEAFHLSLPEQFQA
ncbi:hypothetical protein [Dictyobacter aurantiacus]|uniref:hypothetical protein n=1 Tax=Dictyobacter aurantiacus TaxID=1936993 RepID=UPI000F82FABB|nr:hypothetical protein [Dictyobacter aurantiacus]